MLYLDLLQLFLSLKEFELTAQKNQSSMAPLTLLEEFFKPPALLGHILTHLAPSSSTASETHVVLLLLCLPLPSQINAAFPA